MPNPGKGKVGRRRDEEEPQENGGEDLGLMEFAENPYGVPTIGEESGLERFADWWTGADRNQGVFEAIHDYAEYTPERARRNLYRNIGYQLMNGEYVTPNEMGILAYGLIRDVKVRDQLGFTAWDINTRLEQIEEYNPGSTLLPQWQAWWQVADSAAPDNFILDTLTDLGITAASGGTATAAIFAGRSAARKAATMMGEAALREGAGALTRQAAEEAVEAVAEAAVRGGAKEASMEAVEAALDAARTGAAGAAAGAAGAATEATAGRLTNASIRAGMGLSKLGSGIWGFIKKHPVLTGMGVVGVGGAALMAGQSDTEPQPPEQQGQIPLDNEGNPVYDEAGNYIGPPGSRNPATGELVPFTSPIVNVPQGTSLNPDLANLYAQYGIDPASGQLGMPGYFFGETPVSSTRYPGGLTPEGQAPTSEPRWDPEQGYVVDVTRAGQTETTRPIRPGAEINAEVFGIDPATGQSLLDIAIQASDRWSVPIGILYGVINRTSGWNREAVSSDGSMVGLSLIPISEKGYEFTVQSDRGHYDPRLGTWVGPKPTLGPFTYGEGVKEPVGSGFTRPFSETIRMGTGVTRQQAMNPTYALNWMASKLSNDYRRYGNWETAIIGAASPSGAQYFAENQTFETDYELAFLSDVLTFANNSSLMDPVIDLDRIRAIADAYARSRGGGGPSIPAYQAPDPAEVRNYARDMIEQVLKRKATPVEINSAFTVINDLFRKQYQAKVQSMQGAETTEVNPEERFEEALRTSGEGQFREQATETGSVMSYAGQIARIFQEGY